MSATYQSVVDGVSGTVTVPFPSPCTGSTTYTCNAPIGTSRPFTETLVLASPPPSPDTESFSKVRESGRIKMTPYHREQTTVTNQLVGLRRSDCTLGWPACTGRAGAQVYCRADWVEVHDFASAFTVFPVYRADSYFAPEIYAAEQATLSSVVSDMKSNVDLLTELVEAKNTLEFIQSAIRAARTPLATAKKALSAARSATEASDIWLQYRYALGPLMMSIEDAMAHIDEVGRVYDSQHATRSINIDRTGLPSDPGPSYVVEDISFTARVKTVGRAVYDSATFRALAKTQMNPILTGWELIPYSFVLEWFINIGDWLVGQTYNLADLSSQKAICTSVRSTTTRTFRLVDQWSITRTRYFSEPGSVDAYGRSGTMIWSDSSENNAVIRTEVTEVYSRKLVQPGDIDLNLGWAVNLLRWIDAFALSSRQITDALKKL